MLSLVFFYQTSRTIILSLPSHPEFSTQDTLTSISPNPQNAIKRMSIYLPGLIFHIFTIVISIKIAGDLDPGQQILRDYEP
jgi:hypothetical protein